MQPIRMALVLFCINTSAGPNSFVITGNNLTAGNVTVGPPDGFTFSTSATGTFTSTLDVTQSAGSINQTVCHLYSNGRYHLQWRYPCFGSGRPLISVPVIGTGIQLNSQCADRRFCYHFRQHCGGKGTILDNGCSDIISYGIEYSGD